jgi:two-component system sensor histidine kinase BarA
MLDIRVTTFLKSFLMLGLLGLSLPASALAPISALPTHDFNVFFSGLIYGSLGILSIYNVSLFFTQRDKSAFAFLFYILMVFLWLNTSLFRVDNHILQPLFTDSTNAALIELILLIPFASGIFLMRFNEHQLRLHDGISYAYGLMLATLVTATLYLLLQPMDIKSKNIIIVVLFMLSSLLFAFLSARQINAPTAPSLFCFLGFVVPFFFTLNLSIQQIFTPEISSFVTTTMAFIFSLQAVFFSIALNFKRKQFLIDELHAVTDDLHTNMEFIKEQNQHFDIARKEALKASNSKSRFLANISHEIRTPLNTILGFSQELQTTTSAKERIDQINLINIAAKNLHALVNDVLDLSKIEAGKFKIRAQPYYPLEFFEEIVEINAKSAQMKHLDFNFYLDNLPKKLEGDFLRLKQVIINLLSNALKFTKTGHISLSVVGNILQDETVELIIKVDDTGSGISDKDTQKLFSAFSQVYDDINLENQGSGLGLAISRDIIKMMKGSINVVSEERIGTSFVVRVQQKIVDKTKIHDEKSTFTHKRVLLIDPKPESRRNTARLLKHAGMITTSAESREFIAILADNKQLPEYDFCFLSLPQEKSLERAAFLNLLESLNLKKIIILYSGAKPLEQYNRFSTKVSKQIALPLTLSKLRSLSSLEPRNNRLNPIQRKLQQLPKLSILAVDDVPINLKLLVTFLKNSKINLTTVNSGLEAIEHCKTTEYDLILMDIQMPGMDGVQTTQLIRKIPINLGTPVVALTAHAFNDERQHFLDSGLDDFLPKPIDLESLIALIELWCNIPQKQPIATPKEVSLDITAMATMDWELAIKRANYNEDAALYLLDSFASMLPAMITSIQNSRQKGLLTSVQADVHKLHGACCCTSVPRLQRLCFEIETQFKTNKLHELEQNLDALAEEASRVVTDIRLWLSQHIE